MLRDFLWTLTLSVAITTSLYARSITTPSPQCQRHPLYWHILKLQPKVEKKWAMQFSNLLVKYAKKNKLDPWRSLAIAMQESSLQFFKRQHTVIIPNKQCQHNRCSDYKIIKAISDVGLFQLHAATVNQYQLSPSRLLNDLEYMVSTHFMVLLDKIKQCQHLGNEAWSFYHSRTEVLRKRYSRKVNRFYGNQPYQN